MMFDSSCPRSSTLVAGIHVLKSRVIKTWMAGTIPGSSPGTAKTLRGASIIARVGITAASSARIPRYASPHFFASCAFLQLETAQAQIAVHRGTPYLQIQRIGQSRLYDGNPFRPYLPARRRIARRPGRSQHSALEGDRQRLRRHDDPGRHRRRVAPDRGRRHRHSCRLWKPFGVPWWHAIGGFGDCDLRRFDHLAIPASWRGRDCRALHRGPDARLARPRYFRCAGGAAPAASDLRRSSAPQRSSRAPQRSSSVRRTRRARCSLEARVDLLALLAGAVLPAQGAINGLLRHDIGAHSSSAPSASCRDLAMVVVLLVTLALTDVRNRSFPGLRKCHGGDGSAPSAGPPT